MNQKQKQDDNELSDLKEKLAESNGKYMRALADYQNLERRNDEDRRSIIRFSNLKLIKEILDILDALYESVKHIDDAGLKSIISKFEKLLKNEGVEEVKSDGELFDPEVHEAIESIDGAKDKIIKVHRKGYTLNDKLIRPAIVAVGSGEKHE